MHFVSRIPQILHEEHCATAALLGRLEHAIVRFRKTGLPDTGDPFVAQLLSDLSIGVESELARHFAFEEEQLFAYLRTAGDGAICSHLIGEHEAIRPVAVALNELVRIARKQALDWAAWNAFCRLGRELCERLGAHIEKEEAAFLPVLDEDMDSDTDAELCGNYIGGA